MTEPTTARNARARVRQELASEIKDVARRRLAQSGATGLSLRAVARDVGMVSSAVYRYFPSRDALLTALIIDAYNDVAAAAEDAERTVRRADRSGRWLATGRAVRSWALAHPAEYALIFGTPVPGYAAPTDTVDPAARIPLLIVRIMSEPPLVWPEPHPVQLPRAVRADLTALRTRFAPTLPEPLLARMLFAWTAIVGSISFELFGHLTNVIHNHDAYFDYQMRNMGAELGLSRPRAMA